MNVTLRATTGAKIRVWFDGEMFHAQRDVSASEALAGAHREPQVCIAVDLFEVIAELAGLDLDDDAQSREAIELAGDAVRQLSAWEQDAEADA